MLSLTDMWRAAGGEERNRPAQWARTDTGAAFIAFITGNLKLKDSQVWETRRGKHGGGTWAHWQIAMAFAQSLSAEFHAYCNTIVRDHMERMREARAPLKAPDFNADAFTRADGRELTHFYIGIGRALRLVAKPLMNQGLPVRRSELEEKMRVVVAVADLRVGPTCGGAR